MRTGMITAGEVVASDAAENVRSIAWTIGAIAALILAIGLLWAIVHSRRLTSHIVTKLGSIDVAVNNVAAGEPHLIEKVRVIESAVRSICAHLGIDFHRDPAERTRSTDTQAETADTAA